MEAYLEINRANWDERAPAHAASPDYALQRFLDDPAFISHVVAFDRARLGDVAGLRAVHLQCHIGTDTLSLHRLGARITGVDLSPASLLEARGLAARAGAQIEYVESDVYGAPAALGGRTFELLYTGVGALCWLPSIERWARVVADLLEPGGRLFVRDGHPMLWALADSRPDGLLVVDHPYFERVEPIADDTPGTYVQTEASFEHNLTNVWNHGLGELLSALLDNGLRLTMLHEHDTVPWDALPGRMERVGGDEWRLADRPWRLAHSFTLQAVKQA